MPNPIKGEVGFEAGGQAYTLSYPIDSLCALEERLDLSVSEIGARMVKDMRVGFLRAVFWAGLLKSTPAITEQQAGEVIDEVGVTIAGGLIARAFFNAFPAPEEKNSAGPRARPAKKSAGTGNGSIQPGVS